ncbi:MAG: helix-turn-helix transcriptional regulator [Mycobacterium sp.]
MTQDKFLTRPELAGRWKMPQATLDQWASQGKGPAYALFGRHARYRLSDVIAWENAQFGDVLSEQDQEAAPL